VCTVLAKEIIRARKAITKIHTSKAHLNSIQLQMKNQLGKKKALLLLRIWIEVVMKVLFQHLPRETEELHENPLPGYYVFWLRVRLGVSQI
jgi:hypothetical protein